jgi:hypothetical protein
LAEVQTCLSPESRELEITTGVDVRSRLEWGPARRPRCRADFPGEHASSFGPPWSCLALEIETDVRQPTTVLLNGACAEPCPDAASQRSGNNEANMILIPRIVVWTNPVMKSSIAGFLVNSERTPVLHGLSERGNNAKPIAAKKAETAQTSDHVRIQISPSPHEWTGPQNKRDGKVAHYQSFC